MKKYRVTVNGTPYDITLEVLTGEEAQAVAAPPAPLVPQAPPVPAAQPIPAAPAAPAVPAAPGGTVIKSPMPGNILSVNVSPGKVVRRGDVLLVLEAMKMENEIMSPCDGTVASVNVTRGQTVQSDALLLTIA